MRYEALLLFQEGTYKTHLLNAVDLEFLHISDALHRCVLVMYLDALRKCEYDYHQGDYLWTHFIYFLESSDKLAASLCEF